MRAVVLRDGRRLNARLVVAADGARSAVRAGAGIPVAGWTYPQTGIVCTVGHEKPHRGVAHEHFLPSGPFAMLPMTPLGKQNRSSVVWTERNDLVPAMLALPADEFAAEIERRFGDSLGRLSVIGGRFAYPLRLLHAARYVDTRLALVGDAAHVIHPIAGQGLNLGLRELSETGRNLPDKYRGNRYSVIAHGVGLADEYPHCPYPEDFAGGGYDGEFEPGMTVCVESYIGEVGGAEGVKLEQQVLITETGAEPLSTFPYEDELLPSRWV